MSNISSWSTTAASNNSASPNGFPEGMAPSGVNDSAREVMAAVRTWYEDAQWLPWGDTTVYVAATQFKIAGSDVTARYSVGRRVRAVGSTTGTIYGVIAVTAFSTDTTVTVNWDGSSDALANETLTVSLGILTGAGSAGTGLVLIGRQHASASANIDFTAANTPALFDGSFKAYEIVLAKLKCATDDVIPLIQIGTGAGPTFQSGASDYAWGLRAQGASAGAEDGSAAAGIGSYIAMTRTDTGSALGNATGEQAQLTIRTNALNAVDLPIFSFWGAYSQANGAFVSVTGAGHYAGNTAVTGVRFGMSTGNIASGTFSVYGLR